MKTINDYAELVKEKHALNKTIAPVETDLTDASREYHIGEQFIIDGGLFKAKTEIAQHDALVLNTNYEPADNLIEQIKNAGGGTGTDPRLDVFENNIAPVETDETDASRAYQVGEQLILNNILYDVIAAISVHDVITTTGSGANIAPAGPISSQVEALTNKLNNEIVTRSALGAKNILPFDLAEIKALNTNGTWAGNVYTYRGVAFTVNTDGTISAIGTATGGNASIKLFAASSNYEMLGKEVILTGCPSNGSASTYRIQAYRMASADGSTGTYFDDGAGTDAFTVLNDASGTVGSFAVAVYENATVTNLLFKPMVRLASDPDATYQPYAKTNQELTAENQTLTNKVANEIATRAKVSGHNLLPNYAQSQTLANSIEYTLNADGSIKLNGTANADGGINFVTRYKGLPSGQLIFSKGTANDNAQIYLNLYNGNTFVRQETSLIGVTEYAFNNNYSGYDSVDVGVSVANGKSLSNVTFYPMIRLATDANTEYQPYALTNQQLTEKLDGRYVCEGIIIETYSVDATVGATKTWKEFFNEVRDFYISLFDALADDEALAIDSLQTAGTLVFNGKSIIATFSTKTSHAQTINFLGSIIDTTIPALKSIQIRCHSTTSRFFMATIGETTSCHVYDNEVIGGAESCNLYIFKYKKV